jgi:hypothetical protein
MILNILHIALAVNLLVSSLGVTVHEHICNIRGTTRSLFVKPESCCSKFKKKSDLVSGCKISKTRDGMSFRKKPCCEDKSHYDKLHINATSVDKISIANLPIQIPILLCLLDFQFSKPETTNEKLLRFSLYNPPSILTQNIRILFQSFLC